MPKISELTDITTLAVGDKIPVLDVSDTGTPNPAGTVKYTTPAEIKTSVLGSGVDIGTDGTGNIVTTNGSQTLMDKTLTTPAIAGATITGTVTVGNGCTMTTPVLTSPDINGGTIDGAVIDDTTTVEIDAGAVACSTLVDKTSTQTLSGKTMTTPIVASLYQDAGKTNLITMPAKTDTLVGKTTTDTLTNKTLTTPVIPSLYQVGGGGLISVPASAGTDTVVLAAATQALTNKTLTTPTITTPAITGGTMTGVAIDSSSTFDGTALSTTLGEKGDAATSYTHTCAIQRELTTPANSITITAGNIFTALNLTINGNTKTAVNYDIVADSLQLTVYDVTDGSTYTAFTVVDGATWVITHASDVFTNVVISKLTTNTTYKVVLSFKLADKS